MSSKKDDKKKGGKNNKDKDKQKQKMMEEQAKRQTQKQQAQKRIHVLESSGILDAYEYFLRAICKNGLPQANIFEFAAQQILKYQKKMKIKQVKRQQLNKSPLKREQLSKSPQPRDGSIQKTKAPNLLPFKGDTKEQALKALKK